MPAGDAQTTREITRKLTESLRAYLASDPEGRTVALADFRRQQDNRLSPKPSTITCADLSHADAAQEAYAIHFSDAIFVISTGDQASLAIAREKAEALRSLRPEECHGLIFLPMPGGVSSAQAEHITGLPVCAVIRQPSHLDQLARWIAQD